MATAQKKKTSAKRATKTAAKTAYSAATRSARATNHAATSSANEWAKQSAKLYQLPFANGDMEAAGKQAAAKIQNTAESMMKMGSDAMQQFWSQAQSAAKNPQASLNKMKDKANDAFGFAMPNMGNFTMPSMPNMPSFDPKEAYGKFESFARETAESLTRSTSGAGEALNESMELSRENAEAVVEVSNIAMALLKEIGAEAISYANRSYSQNVEISKEVLTCRTLNDMFDLAGRLAKANLDSFFSQSVKFSEMLFQCATEVSEPLNERVTESAERLSKAMAA